MCLVGNSCTPLPSKRGPGFVRDNRPAGIDVCLNSRVAPLCAGNSTRGYLYRNRLRVLYKDSDGDVFQCEYAVFNCNTRKLIKTTWDTSIECSWKRVHTRVPNLIPRGPEACPSIAIKQTNGQQAAKYWQTDKVFISFGASVGYVQAQIAKVWGGSGPMRTTYDTCAGSQCDFTCTSEPDTCTFSCCSNTRFIREYGHLLTRPDEGNGTMSYLEVCRESGYLLDPLVNLIEARTMFQQQIYGTAWVALTLLSTFQLAAITPLQWFIYALAVGFIDWMTAHASVRAFQTYIADFALYNGQAIALLKGKGVVIDESELASLMHGGAGDPQRAPLTCRLAAGFVFVFLPALIGNMAALLGASIANGVLGMTTAGAKQADIFGILGPLNDLIGKHVHWFLQRTPVGDFVYSFFSGEVIIGNHENKFFEALLGPIVSWVTFQIGKSPMKFLASSVLGRLFMYLMETTPICERNVEGAGLWTRVAQTTEQFLKQNKDEIFAAPSKAQALTRQKTEQAMCELRSRQEES